MKAIQDGQTGGRMDILHTDRLTNRVVTDLDTADTRWLKCAGFYTVLILTIIPRRYGGFGLIRIRFQNKVRPESGSAFQNNVFRGSDPDPVFFSEAGSGSSFFRRSDPGKIQPGPQLCFNNFSTKLSATKGV